MEGESNKFCSSDDEGNTDLLLEMDVPSQGNDGWLDDDDCSFSTQCTESPKFGQLISQKSQESVALLSPLLAKRSRHRSSCKSSTHTPTVPIRQNLNNKLRKISRSTDYSNKIERSFDTREGHRMHQDKYSSSSGEDARNGMESDRYHVSDGSMKGTGKVIHKETLEGDIKGRRNVSNISPDSLRRREKFKLSGKVLDFETSQGENMKENAELDGPVFTTGAGKVFDIPHASLVFGRNLLLSDETEELEHVDSKEEAKSDNESSNSQRPLFTTGAGVICNVSPSALRKGRELLHIDGIRDAELTDSGDVAMEEKPMFTTGAGVPSSISPSSLRKGRELLHIDGICDAELTDSGDVAMKEKPMFTTGAGIACSVSSEALRKGEKLLMQGEMHVSSNKEGVLSVAGHDEPLFVTGSGKKWNISPVSLKKGERLLMNISSEVVDSSSAVGVGIGKVESSPIFSTGLESSTAYSVRRGQESLDSVRKRPQIRNRKELAFQTPQNAPSSTRKGPRTFRTPRKLPLVSPAQTPFGDRRIQNITSAKPRCLLMLPNEYAERRMEMRYDDDKKMKLSFFEIDRGAFSRSMCLDVGLHPALVDLSWASLKEFSFEGFDIPDSWNQLLFPSSQMHESSGCISWRELHTLLLSEGAAPHHCTYEWVRNHGRLISWKLASMERMWPLQLCGKLFSPERVLNELCYRYNLEYGRGKRSALKQIVERDTPASKYMILMVCEILKDSEVSVKLSDGWYVISGAVDERLAEIIGEGKIRVGSKLKIFGAELVGSAAACSPLELTSSTRLHLHYNGVKRAKWDAKLGFQRALSFLTSIHSIRDVGGMIPCIEVIVMRQYPSLYAERVDPKWAFRTQRAENKASEEHERFREERVETLRQSVQIELEADPNSSPFSLQNRFKDLVDEKVMADSRLHPRSVSHVMRFLIRDFSLPSVSEQFIGRHSCFVHDDVKNMCILNLWDCDEFHHPKEGRAIRLFNVVPARRSFPHNELLHVRSTSKPVWFDVGTGEEKCSPGCFTERACWNFSDFSYLHVGEEFDTLGFVVCTGEQKVHTINGLSSTRTSVFVAQFQSSLLMIEFSETEERIIGTNVSVGDIVCIQNAVYKGEDKIRNAFICSACDITAFGTHCPEYMSSIKEALDIHVMDDPDFVLRMSQKADNLVSGTMNCEEKEYENDFWDIT